MAVSEESVTDNLLERLARSEERVRQLIEVEGTLRESNRMLQDFAAIASHDLIEPLRMIEAFLGLLRRQCSEVQDPRAQEYIRQAADGARRAQELVKALLSLHRINQSDVRMQRVELEGVYADVTRVMSSQIAEARAAITHDELPAVMGDADLLVHLFQNLICNAIKFTPKGADPHLHISASDAGNSWRISFRDQGIGIALQDQARIFQPLQRAHARGEYPGSGLGLAICASIAVRHGGCIWVDSSPGEGSTFYVTLPKVIPPQFQTNST